MKVGSLNQKASPRLVGFVFGCIFICIGLLYVMVKSEILGEALVSIADSHVSLN